MHHRVLIVDDDPEICRSLGRLLERYSLQAEAANDAASALSLILRRTPDAMIVDYRMEGTDGLGLMQRLHDLGIAVPTIMLTAYPGVREAIRATRLGVVEYLTKPFNHENLIRVLLEGFRSPQLFRAPHQNGRFSLGPSPLLGLRDTMGQSRTVQDLIVTLSRVARSDLSILIVGETGSGKDLVARTIHQASPRATGPFVALDCGALAESLVENEMFGHEKGAFTGATEHRIGKLEAAKGGTLFLDEIANLPTGAQAKLLRVLEEKVAYRLGGTRTITLDFRLLAACNADLEQMVDQKQFRADLFYRLAESVVRVPPLRERKEDIPHLANRFLQAANAQFGTSVEKFSDEAMARLVAHSWPGNVRELLHVVRAAVLAADGDVIKAGDLRLSDAGKPKASAQEVRAGWKGEPLREIVRRHLASVERETILEALRVAGGNKAKAARMLEIDYKTIHQRLKSYGVAPRKEDGSCNGEKGS